jgi:hypothetical protein
MSGPPVRVARGESARTAVTGLRGATGPGSLLVETVPPAATGVRTLVGKDTVVMGAPKELPPVTTRVATGRRGAIGASVPAVTGPSVAGDRAAARRTVVARGATGPLGVSAARRRVADTVAATVTTPRSARSGNAIPSSPRRSPDPSSTPM